MEIDTRSGGSINPADLETAERSRRTEAARLQKIEHDKFAEVERQKKIAAQWAQNRA